MSDDENNADSVETTEAVAGNEADNPAVADPEQTPDYPPADLESLMPAGGVAGNGADDVNLDVILDVPVTISVEIGRTQIPIRQLLQYNQGSVIELDRHVGEPLDVLVNNTLIAHGEVVMIDDQFGIRLTDVVSPSERVKKLQ